MMECIDLDSSIIGDSEIVQVDFLQDIQTNLSRLQGQLEQLNSKLNQLESTTELHSRHCICMNKSIQQHQHQQQHQPSTTTTSSTSILASRIAAPPSSTGTGTPSASSSLGAHPEITRIDVRVNLLDNKVDLLKYDLRQLAAIVRMNQVNNNSNNHNTNNSLRGGSNTSSSSSVMTASRLYNQRKTSNSGLQQLQQAQPKLPQLQPAPPPLTRMPSSISTTPAPNPTTTSGTGSSMPSSTPPPTPTTYNNQPQPPILQKEEQDTSTERSYPEHPQIKIRDTTEFIEPDAENELEAITILSDDDFEGGEDGGDDDNGNGVHMIGNHHENDMDDDEELDDDEQDPIMRIQPEIVIGEYGDEDDDDNLGYGEQEDNYDDSSLNYDDGQDLGGSGGNFIQGGSIEVEFRDKLGNIIHASGSESTGKIKCPICEVQCMSRRNIIRHYNNKHADPKSYQCTICGAILNRKDSLNVHLKNQHNVIEQAGTMVLVTPILDSQPAPPPPPPLKTTIQYTCNTCNQSFSKADALTSHNCIRTNNTTNGMRSSNSNIKRESSSSLSHSSSSRLAPSSSSSSLSSQHQNNHKCPICSKTFLLRQYLLRHLKTHTETNQCIACGKVYSRKDKLRAHQRSKHGRVLDDNYLGGLGGGSVNLDRASFIDELTMPQLW